jgi:hypothetical protein
MPTSHITFPWKIRAAVHYNILDVENTSFNIRWKSKGLEEILIQRFRELSDGPRRGTHTLNSSVSGPGRMCRKAIFYMKE